MADAPIWSWSVVELADALARREVSSLEAVDACLARIEAVNPRLNAVVAVAGDARDRARQADRDLAAGRSRGPLHGLPFTIKDSLDTAGLVTTAGTIGWARRIPDRDATVVARLRAAGGILLGKTNTPEFTWANETDNDVYGRTSNPYDLDRTPGGSSGGAAAIVAAGGSPFDIGSDTGNSIRFPAHCCGIAGIKPTSGRVPRTGHHPGFEGVIESFTQLGPMARRVDDLALLLAVIAGPDGVDPHSVPIVLGDPAQVAVDRLRVVAFTDNGIVTPTPETMAAVEVAAAALAATGATVEWRVPPTALASEAWRGLVRADGFAWLGRLLAEAGTPGWGSLFAHGTIPLPEPADSATLTALVEQADEARSTLLRWMHEVDVIVCPVVPRPAANHGQPIVAGQGDTYSEVHNLTGWPAAVVRAGTSPDGLPIGVQLVAPPWREDVALAAARIVEAATGGWVAPEL
jgi:amidase